MQREGRLRRNVVTKQRKFHIAAFPICFHIAVYVHLPRYITLQIVIPISQVSENCVVKIKVYPQSLLTDYFVWHRALCFIHKLRVARGPSCVKWLHNTYNTLVPIRNCNSYLFILVWFDCRSYF